MSLSSFIFFFAEIFLPFFFLIRDLFPSCFSPPKKVEISGFQSWTISNPAIDTPSIAPTPLSFLPSNPWLRYNDLCSTIPRELRSIGFKGWSWGNWVGLGYIFPSFGMEWNGMEREDRSIVCLNSKRAFIFQTMEIASLTSEVPLKYLRLAFRRNFFWNFCLGILSWIFVESSVKKFWTSL